MSSNPYVVRTDELFGFLQTGDLEPQKLEVEKLEFVRMCSRIIEKLQTQYLEILSNQNNQDTLAHIMYKIETIQKLKKTFKDKKFKSYLSLYNASEELEKDLKAVENPSKWMMYKTFKGI